MSSLSRINLLKPFKVIFKRSICISSLNRADAERNLNSNYDSIGFIGIGNMAKAIIQGLITHKKFLPEQIYVTDNNIEYMKSLQSNNRFFKEHKINFTDNNDIYNQTNNLLFCVKPQNMKELLMSNANYITDQHLIISIAAGTTTKKIEECLNKPTRIVRIMTNTASLIQEGCSVYSKGEFATENDALFVNDLLKSIGSSEGEIKESLMDVVTALSGSGPAYMFLILESLADGAERMGLDKEMAIRLASQTMLGAASMVMDELNDKNGKHIMQMKEEVCSPGGTTINGIAQLEKYRVRSALINCIEKATMRAYQLNMS